jgi:hypothetical protein
VPNNMKEHSHLLFDTDVDAIPEQLMPTSIADR